MKRNSILRKYAASFFLFFLTPLVLLSLFLQVILYKNLQNDVFDHNTKVIQYLARGAENMNSSLMATCNEISFSQVLQKDLDVAENKIEVLRLLLEKSQGNPYIAKAYLISEFGKHCFSSTGYYSMERLFLNQMGISQDKLEDFQNHLFSTTHPEYNGYEREFLLTKLSFSKRTVIYTYPVSNYGNSLDSWIIIEVNSNRLNDMGTLGAGEYSDGVYMLTDSGTVLYAFENNQSDRTVDIAKWRMTLGDKVAEGSNAYLEMEENREAIIWPVEKTNMGLINVIRSPNYLQDVVRNNTLLIIGIFLFLIAGCILAIHVASNYYRPIHQLSRHVSDGMDKNAFGDDLENIREQYDLLNDRNIALAKELEQKWPLAEERLISELLYSGRADIEETDTIGNVLAGEMKNLVFTVAVIKAGNDSSENLHSLYKSKHFGQDDWSEEVPFLMDTYLYQYNAIVLILGSKFKLTVELRKSIRRSIEHFYGESMSEEAPPVFLGGSYSSYRGIRLSFLEAITLALEEPEQTDLVEDFLKEDELDYSSQSISFQTENILKINRCIATGDSGNLPEIINDIVLDLLDLQKYIRRMYCFDIINNVAKEAQNKNVWLDAYSLYVLTNTRDPKAFGERLEQMLKEICIKVSSNYKQNQLNLIDKIHTYIDLHYRDPALSLVSMSDALGVSPSYVSRFISKNLDNGFNELITKKRMDYAKECLIKTNKSINLIIAEAGFTTSNFMRRFKSIEGVTPGQYRNRYKTEN